MFIETKVGSPLRANVDVSCFSGISKGKHQASNFISLSVTHERFKHYTPEERIES